MKKNIGIIAIFFIGLAILVYPHVAQWYNDFLQKRQVHEFQSDLSELAAKEIENMMEKAQNCNEKIYQDHLVFHDPFKAQKEKLQIFKECYGISDESMFGAIEIPKLELMIPLYLGATDEILSKGIGHVEGSSIPIGGKSTHTVLAGHRGMGTKEMFRNIDALKDGDIFIIHAFNKALTYRVNDQQVIYPDETDSLEIEEDKDLATLLTCHPYRSNDQRLLIQGERTEESY